jgi:hypothetical protein
LSRFFVYIPAHERFLCELVPRIYTIYGPRNITIVRSEILDRMETSLSGILSIVKSSIKLVFKFHVLSRRGDSIFILRKLKCVHDPMVHREWRHVKN